MSNSKRDYFWPRFLHPAAWWLWALGCAVAAARTTNPLILALLLAGVCLVVMLRRGNAPWALSFRLYLWLALFIVVIRIFFRVLWAGDGPTLLLDLPRLTLPDPFQIQLFGPISLEALLSGLYGGAQLGIMIVCIGAANALANPKRLLAAMPAALYEFGAVLVVALSVFPQLAESVQRVKRARSLRLGEKGRRHFLRAVLLPVLADALDRSLHLAAAMDARGYGRQVDRTAGQRHLTSGLLLVAFGAICVGAYFSLDSGGATPSWLALAALIVGLALAGVAFRLAGRRLRRSRYRPDRWRRAETVTALAGLLPVVGLLEPLTRSTILHTSVYPISWPDLSGLSLIGLLAVTLPAWLTPPPPQPEQLDLSAESVGRSARYPVSALRSDHSGGESS